MRSESKSTPVVSLREEMDSLGLICVMLLDIPSFFCGLYQRESAAAFQQEDRDNLSKVKLSHLLKNGKLCMAM